MSKASIDLLVNQAPSFQVVILQRTNAQLDVSVSVPKPDGQSPKYQITAESTGSLVSARETVSHRLPCFCPERHINDGGTFCLGWQFADDLGVENETDAFDWWARLIKFLQLQERASALRRWPNKQVWAHGEGATHQREAQSHAKRIGLSFVNDVSEGRLKIARNRRSSNGPSLRVMRYGRRVFSVWERFRRPVNLRQECICKRDEQTSSVIVRDCEDHADAMVELAFALRKQELAEEKFWKTYKGRACCGTMDTCPLSPSKGEACNDREVSGPG